MARLVSRLAPVSTICLGLLAGCASNSPNASSGSNASTGGGGGGTGASTGTGGGGTGASTGAGTASGAGTGSRSGAAGGGSGSSTTGAAASGSAAPMDAGVDAQAFCRVPAIDAGSLPFVVDTVYHPSGWMGDAPIYPASPGDPGNGIPASPATTARMALLPHGYSMIGDACTPDGITRSSATAKGGCWKVTFIPFPKTVQPGAGGVGTKIGGGPGYGWAGAFWQYPLNNWGSLSGGYPIPTGASSVTFWARGKDGGEKVRFFSGEGPGFYCSDYLSAQSVDTQLPNPPAWKQITIPINGVDYGTANITPGQGMGGYYGGVLGAFGFGVGDQTLPSLDGGSAPPNETDPDAGPVADPAVPGQTFPPFFDSTVVFYIDDIEFQM